MEPVAKKDSMTSLELLKQINVFRKGIEGKGELEHKNLLAVIRDEFEEEISRLEIQPSEYTNERGKNYPMFNLTHAQAKQVLVRESKAVRKAVIKYIEELERKLQDSAPKTYLEALQALVKSEMEKEAQKQIIGELQPKANYVDYILKSPDLMTVTQIAKDYGMSARTLNNLLREKEVQYRQSGQWFLYAKYHDKGYTKSETHDYTKSDGTVGMSLHTKWTQKGRLFIHEELKRIGHAPLIEKAS